MSTFPRSDALAVATRVRDALASSCERIEIAGSIRRRKLDVKDIELVAVPKIGVRGADLWGAVEPVDLLAETLESLRLSGFLRPRTVEVHRRDGSVEESHRVGSAYQALESAGIPIDLFVVRGSADWGVIYALRTGPGDWNTRIVTDCKSFFRSVAGGRVLHFGKHVPCPEERDFFAAVGQPWLDPWDRTVERVRLTQPTVSAP